MENFSRKSMRAILNTDTAYAILDSTEANGSTWCAGGCAILAYALNIAYDYPIYVIYNYTDNQIEHFGVKTPNNTFIDCDGEQREWIRNFQRKEFYTKPTKILKIIQYFKDMKTPDIVIDMEASKKLAVLFKPQPELIKTNNQTLHEGLFF